MSIITRSPSCWPPGGGRKKKAVLRKARNIIDNYGPSRNKVGQTTEPYFWEERWTNSSLPEGFEPKWTRQANGTRFLCSLPHLKHCSNSGLNSWAGTSLTSLQALRCAELQESKINQHFIAPLGSKDQTGTLQWEMKGLLKGSTAETYYCS